MTAGAIWSTTDLPHMCLKDVDRTLAFREAIRRTVRPGDVVVEAGAGTGILSFFAAAAGARRVYAVEIDPVLVASLRASVTLNGLDDVIIVVAGDARTATLPRPADVVIAELIDTGLLDEQQVEVINVLHDAGVIGPATRLIPEGYGTSLELVTVDATFYGYQIAAPLHEWPFYQREAGWLPTAVWSLTAPVPVAEVDFRRPVAPAVDATVAFAGRIDDVANAVRLSGLARLGPGVTLGATNALNGAKVVRLPAPWPVTAGRRLTARVRYRMGDGLGSLAIDPLPGGGRAEAER